MTHNRAGLAWQQYVYPGSRAWHWLRMAAALGAGCFLITLLWLTYQVL
ncbi:hypothetical protein [Nocardia seriolae]|uniref:Uncharacterized protein n=1 Tax=Nocardia seriolae TaxID=37332 RepID=A0A0B8NNV4_9NOCA|nr:hypothetical protein [Nocardia seriolae]APA96799.1 hypothetical protein NS506_02738 [Nocardia seriolae]MTJ61779.1 hypothetical protein [Nocardia seriolae]MTJ75338.1 hypothetical protein [Nocardia seriolae]MTJ86783.1 hypothetical protein [Nocardia seriolae]MTK30778.1 hypothetical protein [Nocardia seriolae]